jgi:uroporphyrinogen III methyltransferase/synthase
MENGRSPETPVALIRRGTMPDQEVVSGKLNDIVERVRQAELKPPAIIVVGETVDLRRELGWWETGPLWGKRIMVTRSRNQASILVKKIRELGGDAIEFPTIEIAEEKNLDQLYKAFKNIKSYHWIIFTSVNAVDIFFRELKSQGHDIRILAGIKIGAIGPATAARLRAEGIVKEIQNEIAPGQKVLLPRARGARDILPLQLKKLGADVEEIFLYQAVVPNNIKHVNVTEILTQSIDYISFTSSSTVTNFVDIIGSQQAQAFSRKVKVVCIGPITAEKAREKGLKVDITASEYTIDGLLQSILTDIASGN